MHSRICCKFMAKKMSNKENKRSPLVIPRENISIYSWRPKFEDEKEYISAYTYELFLFYLNDMEFRCDGKKYIEKVEGSIYNSPSPHVKEIIQMTIDFVKHCELQEKTDDFLIRNEVRNMPEFYSRYQDWYWYDGVDYVYSLVPEESVNSNQVKTYKFFLPFKLKHSQPENIGTILDYHKNKYYKLDARSFFNIIKRILVDKDQSFWFYKDTAIEIQRWIDNNIPEEEATYWFEFMNDYTGSEKKEVVGLILKQLKDPESPFIDKNEDYNNFYWLFSKPNNNTKFTKVNWMGNIGELNYFIKNLVATNKITVKNIWIACSNLFLVEGKEFTNIKIGHSVYITEPRRAELNKIIDSF